MFACLWLAVLHPSSGKVLPVTAYDKDGVRMLLNFASDCPPGRPDVLVMVVSMLNTAPLPVYSVVLQAAVPKVEIINPLFIHTFFLFMSFHMLLLLPQHSMLWPSPAEGFIRFFVLPAYKNPLYTHLFWGKNCIPDLRQNKVNVKMNFYVQGQMCVLQLKFFLCTVNFLRYHSPANVNKEHCQCELKRWT